MIYFVSQAITIQVATYLLLKVIVCCCTWAYYLPHPGRKKTDPIMHCGPEKPEISKRLRFPEVLKSRELNIVKRLS